MRFATLALTFGWLATAAAQAQDAPITLASETAPPAALPGAAPPAPSIVVPPSDPLPVTALDGIANSNPWAMNGPRAWFNAEYLLWWTTPMNTPGLIQTVPTATALGVFGTNSSLPPGAATQVFPDSKLNFGAFSGARLSGGMNLDGFGVDASVFYLPQKTSSATLFNDGTPYSIAETYIRAGTGQPVTLLASLAGQANGGISSTITSRLYGADANVRLPFFNLFTDYTDALVGFRYFNLQDSISTNLQSNLASGASLQVQDSIQTHNNFYGAQVGLSGVINGCDRGFGLNATGKLGLGDMRETAILNGSNTIALPGAAPSTQAGGLYTSGLNNGTFSRDRFAMLYEQNVNLTYNFNRWTQIYVGYSIIWVSSVQRAGEAINPVINDSNLRFIANAPANNTPQQPFQWKANDFWAQGITFGMRLQY
jgi:hypothetical protein